MDGRPVPAPKLIKAYSIVETCWRCGAWAGRYPRFWGDDDGFWQCERCGCTSTRLREGRPYSRKSRQWGQLEKQFNELYTDIPHWYFDTVITDPPMAALDWEAIEAWFRSNNIYRMFIEAPTIEVVQTGQNSYTFGQRSYQVTVEPAEDEPPGETSFAQRAE